MIRLIPLVAFLTIASACGDDDPAPSDAGTDAGPPPPRDAGPPTEPMTYTPDGCSYEVIVSADVESAVDGEEVGSSPTPTQLHLGWAGPTESTFAVNWRSDLETTVSTVLYGTDRAAVEAATGPDAAAGVLAQSGHHILFTDIGAITIRLHEVHVCGLDPSTAYFYKAGGAGAFSPVHELATGPAVGATDPFRFAVTGDSREEAVVFAEIQRRIQDEAVDFQIHSGDIVQLGFVQGDWERFFAGEFDGLRVEDALADMVMMPTSGNHDGLSANYLMQLVMPQEISEDELGEGEQWYSFDYGNANFISLDTTAQDGPIEASQAAWLEADLAAVDRAVTPWVFVLHHIASYSCSTRHGSSIPIRTGWQPAFDRHGVDVVFMGHDHTYERSLPIRGLDSDDEGMVAAAGMDGEPIDGSGTVYALTGGAGAPLYSVNTDCYHTHVIEETHNYILVDVDGMTLRYNAYRLDGTLLDSFVYSK